MFSPRLGSGPNLLDRPAGIVVDPNGFVFVASQQTHKLVRIDPETGEQSVVHARNGFGDDLGELDVGTYPTGLAIRKTAGFLDATDLYVLGGGIVRVIERNFLNAISSSIVIEADAFEINGLKLALREPDDEVTDWLGVGGAGVTRYQPTGNPSVPYVWLSSTDLKDVVTIGSRVFVLQLDPCGPTPFPQSGIWEVVNSSTLVPIAIAGAIDCPVDLEAYAENEFYVLQADGYARSLVRVQQVGETWPPTWQQVPLGSLDDDGNGDTFHMAVVPSNYAPEPGASAIAAAAALALGALSRRKH